MKKIYIPIIVLIILPIFIAGCTPKKNNKSTSNDVQTEADANKDIKELIVKFYEELGYQGVEVTDVTEENDWLYKVTIKDETTEMPIYLTKDKESIFPSVHEATASETPLTKEEAENKVLSFFISSGYEDAQILETTDADNGDYYKVILEIDSQEIESFIIKDGSKIFPASVLVDAEARKKKEEEAYQKMLANLPKAKKPLVELFVMSHCPYGTQIEKGIIPVVKKLGDKIDFELKFVNYAMHGEKELIEQTKQYCIQKNMPSKFIGYLECFLDKGDTEGCIASNSIDKNSVDSCYEATNAEYNIIANLNDENTWMGSYPPFNIHADDNQKYGVSHSPTLVINGQVFSSGRDSQSLLDTICAGFEEKPEECNAEVSKTPPGPGFGYDSSGSAAQGECG
ncbi:hypothetical protein GF362_02795 [Candidatus Dojkabacteria bacterium]|nr:hypothetical protein [Candidatus Dojkabacteria bacterium]